MQVFESTPQGRVMIEMMQERMMEICRNFEDHQEVFSALATADKASVCCLLSTTAHPSHWTVCAHDFSLITYVLTQRWSDHSQQHGPRGIHLEKEDFEKHGYSSECKGCRWMQSGVGRRKTGHGAPAHSFLCTQSMEATLQRRGASQSTRRKRARKRIAQAG